MAVLVALARTPGELVTRAALLAEFWPGGEVYDDSLTQCVYRLRQHLAAAGGNDSYRKLVSTRPKRGYLLNGVVTPVGQAATSLPAASPAVSGKAVRRIGLPALVLVVAAGAWFLLRNAEEPSVGLEPPAAPALGAGTLAVLPFLNASGDPTNDHLSQGVSDGLRERLSGQHGLRVVSRRSSAQFREPGGDIKEIGRLLGVARIVEGRFQTEYGRVMISVELVDARSGFLIWSDSYEQAVPELLLAEQALAEDLLRQLLPDRVPEFQVRPSTRQLMTHELMLLARHYEQQVTDEQVVDEGSLERAIQIYRQVLQADPGSAAAHARLARLLLYQGEVVEAEPHVLEALQLDPERAETFTTLGLYYWAVREDGIGAAYQKAIKLNPSDQDALSYYASWAWMQGDPETAVQYYTRALEVDPLSLTRYADLGYKLAFAGDRARTQPVLQRMTDLFPTVPGYLAASRICGALGDIDEAIAWALKAEQLRPGDPDVLGLLAEHLARIGDFERAARLELEPGLGQLYYQRRWTELVERAEDLLFDQPGDPDIQLTLAFAYGALRQYEDAIRVFESAGLPKIALADSRRANDVHALHGYVCDLMAVGREDDARRILSSAQGWVDPLNRSDGAQGWVPRLRQASNLIVLGESEQALEVLEALPALTTLARTQWLLDQPCFHQLHDEPRYRAVLKALEARMAEQRARLPETLRRHGVALPG